MMLQKERTVGQYVLNLASMNINSLVSILLGLVSVPLALSYWKAELYGAWALITSLAVYLAVSGLGIDVAGGILMTKNARFSTKRKIFVRSLKLIMSFVVLFFFLQVLITTQLPDVFHYIGKMTEGSYQQVKSAATIFISVFILNLPFGLVGNSFAAYGKAYLNTLMGTILSVVQFLLLLITIYFKLDLGFYAMLYGGATLLAGAAKILLFRSMTRGNWEKDDSDEVVEDAKYSVILKSGLRMALYGVGVLSASTLSALIISNKFSVGAATPYLITNKLFQLGLNTLITINIAAGPLLGEALGRNDWEWIKNKHEFLFRVSVILGGLVWLGSFTYMADVIEVWTGRDNYVGDFPGFFMGAAVFTYFLSNLNTVMINSFNYTKRLAWVSWGEACLGFVLSLIMVNSLGILGVVLAFFLGSLLVTTWGLPLLVYRQSQNKLRYDFRFLSKVLGVLGVLFLCKFAIVGLLKDPVAVAVAKVLIIVIYGVVVLATVGSDSRRQLFRLFRVTKHPSQGVE